MQNISEIEELIKLISKLPGLGPKSAKRIVLKLVNNRNELVKPLANTLAQVYKKLNKELISTEIFNFIISIDEDFNLSEQYDLNENKQLSAKKLTWNYAELYNYIN